MDFFEKFELMLFEEGANKTIYEWRDFVKELRKYVDEVYVRSKKSVEEYEKAEIRKQEESK